MVMQTPFLLMPKNGIRKTSTIKSPILVEHTKKINKICALLKRGIDGNEKTGNNKRRSRPTRHNKT